MRASIVMLLISLSTTNLLAQNTDTSEFREEIKEQVVEEDKDGFFGTQEIWFLSIVIPIIVLFFFIAFRFSKGRGGGNGDGDGGGD